MEAAVRAVLEERRLQVLPAQVTKIMQLHVASTQRIGIIVVGPSGCGKTTLWQASSGSGAS